MSKFAVNGRSAIEQGLQACPICTCISEFKVYPDHCPVCRNTISVRKKNSLQLTWALIITAAILLIPANLFPITILLKNGTENPDTIFSGISSLIKTGMPGIAIIVFFASFVVPILKILILTLISLSIHFKWNLSTTKQLYAHKAIDFIGKWSVLDLFVISIMSAVFNKGVLLSVYPGTGASAFTLVIITTLFATRTFDTRLIWDTTNNG
ncbi:MAG: paraquat-inducible protein A [Psychromonas sp.]|nr:paraquat-inducible protein A [Psychromonas sp.]